MHGQYMACKRFAIRIVFFRLSLRERNFELPPRVLRLHLQQIEILKFKKNVRNKQQQMRVALPATHYQQHT
jgi:hypothetical protein